MKNNTEMPGYILFLRGFVFCISAFLWILSINWSADGFSIDNAELYWIGIGLALSVTGAELLFNRGSANPTIFMVGLAAYIFGFVTNFLGISAAVGINFSEFATNPLKVAAASIGVAALSVIVEAAPESFLLWALYPKEKTPGDFISTLLGGSGMFKTKNVPPRSNSFVRSDVPFPSVSVPERSNVPVQNTQKQESNTVFGPEQEVNRYVQRYKSKNKGKTPSYREIVKNTSLTSTSQVAQYIKR